MGEFGLQYFNVTLCIFNFDLASVRAIWGKSAVKIKNEREKMKNKTQAYVSLSMNNSAVQPM